LCELISGTSEEVEFRVPQHWTVW